MTGDPLELVYVAAHELIIKPDLAELARLRSLMGVTPPDNWHSLGTRVLAGRFGLMFDHYQVSDSNQVQTGLFRYSPPFKLFSRHLRPVIGLEHRKTRFASPAYWSPVQGYGLGYAGVEAEWSRIRAQVAFIEQDRYLAPEIEAMRRWALRPPAEGCASLARCVPSEVGV